MSSAHSTPSPHPFKSTGGLNKWSERGLTTIFASCAYLIILCALFIFFDIGRKGLPTFFKSEAPFINTEFFTENPQTLVTFHDADGKEYAMSSKNFDTWTKANPQIQVVNEHRLNYSAGGILNPLAGTALLVILCMTIALFIGVAAAVYLSEYCGQGRLMSAIRLSILNLAGVPSIVFALFGWGVFCYMAPILVSEVSDRSLLSFKVSSESYLSFEGWGTSLISGAFTLAIMVLPVIITACEESLRAVPKGFREASFALGSTKWQTIRKAVLPYALPGIMTASILGITRVAGETAPIMLTAAATDKNNLPWEGLDGTWSFFGQSVQALPFHIYTLAKLPDDPLSKPMQNGATLAFLLLVMGFAMLSIILRNRVRKKLKW
ncbi:phosphate ABC transporter permease PstA [Verrucomicrobiaceae bacterium N1E253]|uniref:Phosphate ABC transporter permease PstA n=1 Tax=Oceaniferula marina TaxID=2748318 RepID=A0A851GJT2_9BACT|nr:PstA family ABC transporter permease [Oceaniferula marina]NWK57419.1 phosphate ABC transporter permease PstA [Oceaniferula marina]